MVGGGEAGAIGRRARAQDRLAQMKNTPAQETMIYLVDTQ